METDARNTTFTTILCVLIFLSNLSQLPLFVDDGITQYISMPFWIVLLIYGILSNKKPIFAAFRTVVTWSLFFAFFYLLMSAADPAYTKTALPSVLMISVFVLLCTSCVGAYVTEEDLSKIFTSYVISVVIVGVSVYNIYIANASLASRVYLYDSKNSISQILLTAWLIILFTKFHGRILTNIIWGAILIFFTYEIIMLQSRATIIGIPLAILYIVSSRQIPKRTKNVATLFCIGAIVLLLIGNGLQYFIDMVIYAGRDASNINDISSGRSDEWANFWNEFERNPLVGIGRCKRESIILTSLLEFGIIGGVPLLILALSPLLFIYKYNNYLKGQTAYPIFLIITITYLLNGVFEQLAPFGPGAKCYFLWFLYGIIGTQTYYKIHNIHTQ